VALVENMQEERNRTVKLAAPLRIGIMIDSPQVSRWVAKILTDIQKSEIAEVMLVIINDAPRQQPKRSLRERLRMYWIHGLYNRYTNWDYRSRRATLDAFETVDISDLVRTATTIRVKPTQKGFVDRFADGDVTRIQEAQLDVLFRFGFRIIRGEILKCARYGVWSFHHGDSREYRGAPPGFWEMYERSPVTGTMLQILTDELDGGRVIYRSSSATNFESLYLNRNTTYWKTAEFALRRLRDLHRYGWEYIRALPVYNESNHYTKAIYKTPRAPVMIRFLARQALSWIKNKSRAAFVATRTQWFIAIRKREGSRTVLNDTCDFRILKTPKGHFYADPFLFKRGDRNYMFFENFKFTAGKAVISFVELDAAGNCSEPEVALERDYHLSYPFVFEWRGQVYMLPETKARGSIELYRAGTFPRQWTLEKVIVENVRAVDPTLLEHHGKFWLFANIAAEGGDTMDELHLFYAESPLGPWTPHPQNPVVSDVRRARPAGSLFLHNGQLVRPAQDCSLRYGYAMVFNRVEALSETEYREVPFHRIGPEWQRKNLCTHTYNRSDDYEVLDGMFSAKDLRFRTHGRFEDAD